MKRHHSKQKFGRKVTCPCPRRKKAFCPLIDDVGRPTGGGKCWSDACGQKFMPPPSSMGDVQLAASATPALPQREGVSKSQYIYTDVDGNSTLRVNILRRPDGSKNVWQDHWNGVNWVNGAGTVRKVPYRLPELKKQIQQGGTIYIVEGEKDVETAHEHGLVATCNPGGAGKWTDEMSEFLKGAAAVIIIPDHDDPGLNHANEVAESLKRTGIVNVKILVLRTLMPDLPPKGDVTDFFERGGSIEELQRASDEVAASAWESSRESVHEPPELDLDLLPRKLRGLMTLIGDRHQRIALLVSVITTIASILPGVRFRYFTKQLGAVLYVFVVGLPGAGKSVIELARKLIMPIHKALEVQSADELKAYKAAHSAWKKSKEVGTEPERPKRKTLLLPADSTAPSLIRYICELRCALIFDTEADSIQMALGKEYGDFSSALRKNWQGESVSQARVRDDVYISTDEPHLCMVVSGTPDQISVLAKHAQNGLTSRISFVMFPRQQSFRDPFDTSNDKVLAYVNEYSEEVLRIWQLIEARTSNENILIELTAIQQNEFRTHFGSIISDLDDDSDQGMTLRSGVVAMRIMLVLTVLRNFDANNEITGTLEVSDDDFRIGMALAEYLRVQSEFVAKNYLNQGPVGITTKHEANHRIWYERLPEKFTTAAAIAVAKQCGFGKSTVFSLLDMHPGIVKVKHGHYRKSAPIHGRGP